jgi:MFS family permease
MPADRIVAVSGRLILLSGVGSVVGPLIGAMLMARFKIYGVFYFMAAAALFLTFLAAGRSFTSTAPHHAERPFEILAPQAATLAHAPHDTSDKPLPPEPIKVASEDN